MPIETPVETKVGKTIMLVQRAINAAVISAVLGVLIYLSSVLVLVSRQEKILDHQSQTLKEIQILKRLYEKKEP